MNWLISLFKIVLPIYCLFVVFGTVLFHGLIDSEKPDDDTIGILASMNYRANLVDGEVDSGRRKLTIYYLDFNSKNMTIKDIVSHKGQIKTTEVIKGIVNSQILTLVIIFVIAAFIVFNYLLARRSSSKQGLDETNF